MKLPLIVDCGADEISKDHFTVLVSDASGETILTVHGKTPDEVFERAQKITSAFNSIEFFK